jgi:23S rRNA (cytidine1920-2'-O)/16S rRNA (cytidine1409-2'-O)-methyltransferase
MASRVRLDRLLVDKGLVESREKAARLILAGEVMIDGQRVDKAGALVPTDADVDLRGRSPYVSRGGEKLAHALQHFTVATKARVCIDVGSSTGGFTDCLLQRGASRVFAVDVGTAQLDAKLRKDPRVVAMEQTNARALDPRVFDEQPSLAVIDVSFISLEKVLPAVFGVLAPRSEIVALVKPQFEVGRAQVGKGGVVRDPEARRDALRAAAAAAADAGLEVRGFASSALPGPKGNLETFIHLARTGPGPGTGRGQGDVDVEAAIAEVEP